MFIPIPGVARLEYLGKIGTQPWAVIHYWQDATVGAPWTQANLDLLTLTAFNSWSSTLHSDFGGNVTLTETVATDLTSDTGLSSDHLPTSPAHGTGGNLQPASACLVVQNRIAARYRGGHPRSYWPGNSASDMANEFQWQPTLTGQFQLDMVTHQSNIIDVLPGTGGTAAQHVVPRFHYTYVDDPVHHKYTHTRSSLKSVNVVGSYLVNQQIGSQRRRLTL